MLGLILFILLCLGLYGAFCTDEGFFWFLLCIMEVFDD